MAGPATEGGAGEHSEPGPEAAATLRRYAQMLATAPLNLVAAGDRGNVWSRHVVESIAVCRRLPVSPAQRWLDLGTGGGLPGVVLAVLDPSVDVTLLDAREKKARALAGFLDELGLGGAHAISGRAEQLARTRQHRTAYDGVVCRAVARLVPSVELARGFVRSGGHIAVVRGRDAEAETVALSDMSRRLGVEQVNLERITDEPRETWLVTMRAAGPPPRWIPRRDGLPTRRPLDAAEPADE